MIYKNIIRPILFRFDPENAHDITHHFAGSLTNNRFLLSFLRSIYKTHRSELQQEICGLTFPNPVGLAAGFDKNGKLPCIMEAVGFGYTEIGSITAQPSVGNSKPRLFRLSTEEALINRMGLNNDGADVIIKRIATA